MSPKLTIALFLLLAVIQLGLANTIRSNTKSASATHPGSFSSNLFNLIASKNEKKNIIISPFSIESALTLLYMGAEGKTAQELEDVLQLKSSNKLETAVNYCNNLNSINSNKLAQLNIANGIYTRFNLVPKFNETASKYFQANSETVNFSEKEKTANKINSWVEDQTNNKINNLIAPESIDDYTTAMLVNAIYFKAPWLDQFSIGSTKNESFWISASESVKVDTMSGEMSCKYASIPELDATAIELMYDDSSMVMDIILPNSRNGLKDLERKFPSINLVKIFSNVMEEEVNVRLPKFKIEFDTNLISALTKMGLKNTFMWGSNFEGLFDTLRPVKVSDVVHKALIDVNEYGSEAAAATYVKLVYLSAFSEAKNTFTADHPFMFVIRNNETVYFMGHVTQFSN